MSQRNWILTIISVAVLVVIFFVYKPAPVVKNHPSSGTDIVAFGDSLIEGVGSSVGGGFIKMLSDDLGVPIVNLGVSGDTTFSALGRIGVLDRYRPKVVIILLGGNDFLRRVPQEETFSNLDKIIVYAQERGAAVLLLGVRGGILRDEYEVYFNKLAKERQTAYVSNVLGDIFGRQEFMADPIHPNDAGYKKIKDRVLPILGKLLE